MGKDDFNIPSICSLLIVWFARFSSLYSIFVLRAEDIRMGSGPVRDQIDKVWPLPRNPPVFRRINGVGVCIRT